MPVFCYTHCNKLDIVIYSYHMKLLYCFKKSNGEYTLVDQTLAYTFIYEKVAGSPSMEYLGAFDENLYLELLGERIFKVKEFKSKNLTPEVKRKMEINAVSGAVSQEEWDFSRKVNEFEKMLEKEDTEKLLEKATKIFPDKSLNVVTPRGKREEILANLQR